MKANFLISWFFISFIDRAYASCFPMIGVDGQCKLTTQISSYISGSKIGSSSSCPIIGVIDLTNDNSGCTITNSLLSTTFPSSHTGVSLETTASSAIILARYDTMYSVKYCGSKAVDFLSSLSNSLIVILPAAEVSDIFSSHEQTMRRIANGIKSRVSNNDKSIKTLYFMSPDMSSTVQSDVIGAFDAIWNDVSDEGKSLADSLDVRVIHVDADNINSIKTSISETSESQTSYAASAIGSTISETWGRVGSGVPRAILSQAQRQSVYTIESAFGVGIAYSEGSFSQWQSRISSGKVVGKFGSRVQELLENVHVRFMDQTRGSISVRERAQRARQLRENIESVANVLFRQQIGILQTTITNRFRAALINLATSTDPALQSEDTTKEREQQALRKALFEFRTMALELEVESLGLSSASAQSELSSSLQTIATEFPESSFGRLEAIKRVERETKRPKKKKGGATKGKRAVNIGLNLVGMLRPPGHGSLQGFIGYSTALLGLPFEILMGVQNDGDSPEIMGEDREYPLLRLQPKVSFDIDV